MVAASNLSPVIELHLQGRSLSLVSPLVFDSFILSVIVFQFSEYKNIGQLIHSNRSSVTEIGFAVKDESNMSIEEAVLDHDRVQYFRGTTNALLSAVLEDEVDVRAYFAWSMSLFIYLYFLVHNKFCID